MSLIQALTAVVRTWTVGDTFTSARRVTPPRYVAEVGLRQLVIAEVCFPERVAGVHLAGQCRGETLVGRSGGVSDVPSRSRVLPEGPVSIVVREEADYATHRGITVHVSR